MKDTCCTTCIKKEQSCKKVNWMAEGVGRGCKIEGEQRKQDSLFCKAFDKVNHALLMEKLKIVRDQKQTYKLELFLEIEYRESQ